MGDVTVLLEGVVGSRAYGLATPGSDEDRLGIFAAPTAAFHGLRLPIDKSATRVATGRDTVHHEARKYALLALANNPTVTELLWLRSYTVTTELGEALIGLRSGLLSKAVRTVYLGYATQQFRKMETHGRFGGGMDKRAVKHARHLYRLVEQGCHLWVTGELEVQVRDPGAVFDFAERAVKDADVAANVLARAHLTFNTPTCLPDEPDTGAVEAWLHSVREAM